MGTDRSGRRCMLKARVIWLLLPNLAFGACAAVKSTPPILDPRLQALEQESTLIGRQADQCVRQATQRTDNDVNYLMGVGNAPSSAQVQTALDQGDGAIAKCRADEALAQAQVAKEERAEYLREGQAERSRAALMSTLTGSLSR
jgi:hypothetical protein